VRVTEPKIQKHEVQEGARREGTAVTQEASAQCSKEGVVRMAGQLSKIRNQTSTRLNECRMSGLREVSGEGARGRGLV